MLIVDEDRIDLDIDALGLTIHQRAAMRIDTHVVLRAGAGSGKTHTLAWRYVRLLVEAANQGSADPEPVVVLTFTEKAAEEMSERCHARLHTVVEHALAQAPEHPTTKRLDAMLDRFESARIGTFHGFCARLVREFPSPAVPADLDIAEPTEATGWVRAAAERGVDAWASARDPRLLPVLDAFGSRRALVAALQRVLFQYALLQSRLDAHASGAVSLDSLGTDIETWLARDALPAVRACEALLRPGGTAFWETVRAIPTDVPDDPLEVNALAKQVLSVFTSGGQLRTLTHFSAMGRKDNWPGPRRYQQAKLALGVLGERMSDWPDRKAMVLGLPTQADVRMLEALEPFAALAGEVRASHQQTLQERRAIDFDALQDRAVEAVLTRAEVAEALRARHLWWMVDEFQDTDPRQWALVRAVSRHTFLVGDVKQAIYGFRGGEVRLFAEAARELGVEPLELPDNFRSQPVLIDWFNQMFPRVLPDIWSPLAAARPEAGGSVTRLVADDLEGQAELTARFLTTIPAEAGEIAILLRTRTHLATWERALRQVGVGYRIARGVGFWARPEVVDVCQLVIAIATGNPIATVGALRSPLFGQSDQGIQDVVLEGARTSAVDALEALMFDRYDDSLGMRLPSWLDRRGAWRHWDGAARANVRQLLGWIESWNLPLQVLADRLQRRIMEVPIEAEATPGAQTTRVVLMTIHASKGLEFPVVVVPEMSRLPASRPDALSVARLDGEYVFATGVDDEDAEIQSRAVPGLLSRTRAAAREAADAEYRRLLYVALTRARDHLVLVGPEEASERSWAGLLQDPPSTTRHVTTDDLPSVAATGSAPGSGFSPLITRPTIAPPAPEIRASDLAAWSSCPAAWFRTARLGQVADDDPVRIAAGIRGQVLHGAIEDRVHGDRDRVSRRFWAAARQADLPPEIAQRCARTIERHRSAVAADPVLERWLDAPGFDELAVRQPFDGGVFIGRIDRLVLDREAGGFLVVDYKTQGQVDAEVDARRYIDQLAAYAWAADRVLEAHGQPPVVGAVVYFTALARAVVLHDLPDIEAKIGAVATTTHLADAFARAADHTPPCASCRFAGNGCKTHGPEQLALF